MQQNHITHSLNCSKTSSQTLELPNLCPICKNHIVGEILYAAFDEFKKIYYTFDLCPSCNKVFIATHNNYGKVIYCEPNKFIERSFSDELSELSPQFTKIYNQANAAECSDLDEIAGIGYRKSLEFLVKDFCISENKTETEKIKSLPLAKCIEKYIDNAQIKELAQKCTWLGNDETHYTRKHTDKDLTDLKKFIEALMYFISMHQIYKESQSVTPA